VYSRGFPGRSWKLNGPGCKKKGKAPKPPPAPVRMNCGFQSAKFGFISNKFNLPGTPVKSKSLKKCVSICTKTKGCVAFSYMKGSAKSDCWLKSSSQPANAGKKLYKTQKWYTYVVKGCKKLKPPPPQMRVRKARAQERGAKHRVKKVKKELGAKQYRKKFMGERKIEARKAKARRKMFERKAKGHARRIEKSVKKKKPRIMDGGRGRWMERRRKKRVIKIKKRKSSRKKFGWKRSRKTYRWRRAKLLNNKMVMRRVKSLVAYAIAARPKDQDMQRQLSRSRSVIVDLIWQLGNHWKPGTNPAFQYLRAFQRAAKAAPFGFGPYLLDDVNRAVIRGKKALFSYTTGKHGVTMMGLSRSAIGLTSTPHFITRLRVPSRRYQKALLTVHKKGFKFSNVIKCFKKGGKKACKGVVAGTRKGQENKNKVAMYWVSKYRRKFKRAGF